MKTISGPIPMEHERRFVPLLGDLPFHFEACPKTEIVQGYLEDGSKTRVRKELSGNEYTFTRTVKIGEGISRTEDERPITASEYYLLSSRASVSLKKTRYFIKWEEVEYQLNLFQGTLWGYVQIEVEFKTAEEARAFVPPPWLGVEVTHDPLHDNYMLAKNGIPK